MASQYNLRQDGSDVHGVLPSGLWRMQAHMISMPGYMVMPVYAELWRSFFTASALIVKRLWPVKIGMSTITDPKERSDKHLTILVTIG